MDTDVPVLPAAVVGVPRIAREGRPINVNVRVRWQRQALPSNRALPGGGRRSKGADSQSRCPVKKQNAPGAGATALRANIQERTLMDAQRPYSQARQSVNAGDRRFFPHLQSQRVCRGHVLDQKPVSRRQDGGTSRKMGMMKHF